MRDQSDDEKETPRRYVIGIIAVAVAIVFVVGFAVLTFAASS